MDIIEKYNRQLAEELEKTPNETLSTDERKKRGSIENKTRTHEKIMKHQHQRKIRTKKKQKRRNRENQNIYTAQEEGKEESISV